jgi:outer membrane protein
MTDSHKIDGGPEQRIMKTLTSLLILLLLAIQAYAENIDEYIQVGLDNNLALKQKEFNYKKSMHALKEARGLFLPALSIEARYTRAGGGREIEFPVGDLLNPVYSTLNQLTGSQRFPQLENENILFLREKEHDTKLRLVQPVFQYGIYSNYNLKDELNKSSREEVAQYKQELVKEIKTAYYQYIQSAKILDLYNGTLELVKENVRVSQVLFDNNMATKDAVLRSKAEKLQLEQQLASASENHILARSYFNFLLNRDLNAEIKTNESTTLPRITTDLQTAEDQALEQRKEISQLKHALNASQSAVGLASANFYPGLNIVFDYGYQGTEYRFNKNDDYWMASVLLSWNLFNGFQDSEKKQQAKINYKILQTQLSELKLNIRLQVKKAFLNLETAKKKHESAIEQENFNKESFKIISKKYEQGMASQIEFIDARVNKTNSEITSIVSYYDYLIKNAEFTHLTAASPFENNKE